MKADNPRQTKSDALSLRIVTLYRFLCDAKKEFILAKPVARNGTSLRFRFKRTAIDEP